MRTRPECIVRFPIPAFAIETKQTIGFCPRLVFRTLFYNVCYTAHRNVYSTKELATKQCERIETRFCALFQYMVSNGLKSADTHRENLEDQQKYWGWLRSNSTCLLCVRRSPEHILSCGHSICDQCTQIYGKASLGKEEEYIVPHCILCGAAKDLIVQLKPPTSAPRVVSIDGGGPRGIIPLENLDILQGLLGSDLPLCDMIDLTVGCSSGGLIALSRFMLQMDAESCKSLFRTLAKKVFSPSLKKRFFQSWISDSFYEVRPLEEALKDHYGPTQKMFDTPMSGSSFGRVAVTTSTIKDGDTFIFANYNGAAPHRAESGNKSVQNPRAEPR
jgi:hypothetical protein